MNCSEFNDLLDLFIDDELDADARAELERHAAECSDCHAKLTASEQLREVLSHLDDGMVAPLPAQAGWRAAIRAEAKRRRIKRIYSVCGAVAAACVLTVGAATMLRGGQTFSTGTDVAPQTGVLVEADGLSENAELQTGVPGSALRSASAASVSYVDRTVYTDDSQSAYGYLKDIIAEYGGSVDRESDELEGHKVYLSIPGENVTDFISAVDHIGTAIDENSLVLDTSLERVNICVTIVQN